MVKLLAMLNKIFLLLLLIAVLVMGVLTFLCWTQLQSVGFSPSQIVQNFEKYDLLIKSFLWISALLFLVLANVILWNSRKAWALWLTFAYFAVFLMLNMWWLGESLSTFQRQNNLTEGSLAMRGLVGAIFVVIVGIALFFNQFLVLRMNDRMYGKPPTTGENKAGSDIMLEESPTEKQAD